MWPPVYSVKKHPRARRVKLRTSLQGLEVIVPLRFNVAHIPDILIQHKDWIIKKLSAIREHAHDIEQLPNKINLCAINQIWGVEYLSATTKLRLIVRPDQSIALMGKQDFVTNKKILLSWVKSQAKLHLSLALDAVSREIKLPYEKVTIRDQRTRWGSCSRNKTISLNYKLLFLPSELMRHILIHELCHTVHLNHSEKFWNLVAKFDPQWRENRKAIRQMDGLIPRWISY